MTNREAGEELIRMARELFGRDVQGAWQAESYNLTIRRAQETVELALKGALRILGTDYPKVHDVGSLFAEQAQRKIPGVDKAMLGQMAGVSRRLTAARTPAFYLERRYGEVEARQAVTDARFVLEAVERMTRTEGERQKDTPIDHRPG
ncbi:MAG: HEPN domain-containing protein [Anaerolineae bacterium]